MSVKDFISPELIIPCLNQLIQHLSFNNQYVGSFLNPGDRKEPKTRPYYWVDIYDEWHTYLYYVTDDKSRNFEDWLTLSKTIYHELKSMEFQFPPVVTVPAEPKIVLTKWDSVRGAPKEVRSTNYEANTVRTFFKFEEGVNVAEDKVWTLADLL
ncbi:MAG: hypothetical protein KF836_12320 [Fimbriimonadaceae bacterium]|nr:hypothetical protein [Fimbriimonadaceae bacterium]